jgi:Uma2 family endonuclease
MGVGVMAAFAEGAARAGVQRDDHRVRSASLAKGAEAMATVLIDEATEIPDGVASLTAFRQWATGGDFPKQGRIDWVGSRIEVDMSPEDLFTHGSVKAEIVRVLGNLCKARSMHLFTGETRVSSADGDVSAEPDVVVVSDAALSDGRVRLVPSAGGRPDRYVELEGGVDLIVEIVSDSSVTKDTQRLLAAYRAAGVKEYWVIDARGEDVHFAIHCWADGERGVEMSPEQGLSAVFSTQFALTRHRNPAGRFVYDLVVTEATA